MTLRAHHLIILLGGLLLAACTPNLSADVTRFNNLAAASGQTFTILPDQAQVGSLEFQSLADRVAGELTNYGFQAVPATGPSDFVVFVHYGSPGARQQVVYWGGRPPWPRGPYPYPPYDVYWLFSHFVDVEMVEGPAWRRGERRSVFQGRAITETTARETNVILPYLVRALFTNFPGNNGQTMRISVPMR
jgi:hypothetical protein